MKKRSLFTALAVTSILVLPLIQAPHAAHAAIAPGSVVVNEIMYNQASGTSVPEWVELYNTTSSSIDLSGYKLTDNGVGSTSLTEGVYTIPSGTTIPAGGYLTVGNSYSTAQLKWSGNFALSNSGDGVALFNDANGDNLASSSEVIDSVEYSSTWGGNGTGYSLERISPTGTTQSSSNWASSTVSGGTMGQVNSVYNGTGGSTGGTGGTGGTPSGKTIMWDNGHGETAGNADWTITGANSSFADALKAKGYTVTSTTSAISSSVLSGVSVLVIPEPNINFTSAEKSAINTFVANGGGVYFIADHITSDRNNDGWDSVQIYDGSTSTAYPSTGSWVGATYGFYFNFNNVSADPMTDLRATPITTGATSFGYWNGSTIHSTGANSSIVADIYMSGQSDPVHLHGSYGSGRFAALGDSSPYDDGTGAAGNTLYDGWDVDSCATIGVNTVMWLAKDK